MAERSGCRMASAVSICGSEDAWKNKDVLLGDRADLAGYEIRKKCGRNVEDVLPVMAP